MRKLLLSLVVLMTFGFYGFSQNEIVTDVIGERLQSCDLLFDLYDSGSDGWNGAALLVSFSDGSPSQSYTISSGNYAAAFTLEVNSGTTVTLTWQPGGNDSECFFWVSYADDGIEIYYLPSGSEPSEGFLYEFVMDCSHPCPGVGNLTATAGGGGTMEISWTAPLGYVDNYDIYRDDEYIGSTSEPYYLDEGLEDGIYVYCVVTTFINGCIGQTECVEGVCSDQITENCDLLFYLSDSWGDGWNDAALLVSFSDGSPSQSYTVPSGQDYAVFTLEVNSGTTVTLTWQPGRFDSECSFVVSYADDGIEIYSVSEPSEGFLYEFVMDCSHPCPGVGNLTATAVGGGTMEISWTAPMGDVDHYDIYRDDVYIASTPDPLYFDDGLEDGIYVYCVVPTFIDGCIGQTKCVEGVCSDPITNSCNLLFDLFDSYGDGWNGAALLVSFSDGSPSQSYTVSSGNDYASFTLEVNSGTTVTLTWQSGYWDQECSFVVSYADNGIEIYSVSQPSAGVLFEFVMDCSHPCPGVGDLTATAVGGGIMEISWTAPMGDVDHYDIYRDDVYIASTPDPLYFDEGLEDGIYVYCVVPTFIDGCIGQTKCVEANTNSCNLQFDLFDSYVDGWNDAALLVSFSDGSPSQLYTVSFGNDYASFTLEVNSGTTVTLTWLSGYWDYDCSFVVSYADNGIEIYSVSKPSAGVLFEFVMDCTVQCAGVKDLSATADGGGIMEISWTAPMGDVDHYDIYRDDVYIASTPDPLYFDEGLEDGIYVYCVVPTFIDGCIGLTKCVEANTNSCNLQFDLFDSYGDGWNGAALLVSFSDGSPSQSYTVSFGYASFTLEVNSGTTVTLTWQSGYWDQDCSFVVSYADDGVEIYSVSEPSEGLLYEFVMDCSHPCPGVGDLTATAGGGGTMEISWTAPMGDVDHYDIYRDDVYIASTPDPLYFDDGLEDGIYVYCVVPTFIDGCIGQTECVEGVCSDPNTNSCNLQFDLFDSYGDGWNDAALLVSFSDGSPSQVYTLFSGSSAHYFLEVNSGTTVTLTWQPGGNDSECYFVVSYADNGIEIYSVSDPSSGFLYEFVMGPGVEDLTATAVGGGTMEISWTDPTGDIDHYDLYRDDVLIATTTTTSYTDEGLEDGIYVYCVVTTSIGGCVGQTECVEGVCSDPITNSCNLLFDLYDSWGDGWDGDAALLVSFSDGSPSQTYTLNYGSSAQYILEVNSGTTVTLTWQAGNNDSECSFFVSYADNGVEIYGVSDPSEGFLYEFVMDCSPQCPGVNNLTATAGGGGTMEISWTAPAGDVDHYDIYRDDVYIASTPDPLYFDDGLEDGIYVYCVVPTFIDGCIGQTKCVEGLCADMFTMPTSGTIDITTCAGLLYDDGGPDANYSNNCDGIAVIHPELNGAMVHITGTYEVESNYDKIYIYDGASVSGTLIGTYTGTGSLDVVSTLGALTVEFTSDGSVNKPGFAFTLTCEEGEVPDIPGDADGDGVVNALDIVRLVNYIFGDPGDGFIFDNADINGDGVIDALDLVTIINLIFSKEIIICDETVGDVIYTVENGVFYMETPVEIGAFVLKFDSEVSVLETLDDFDVVAGETSDGSYLIVAYSMKGITLKAGKYPLMNVGNAKVTGYSIATPDACSVNLIEGGILGFDGEHTVFCAYPNPFNESVTINFEPSSNTQLVITNVYGQTINLVDVSNSSSYVWKPGSISNGIYFITIKGDGITSKSIKLIYQK